MAPPSTKTVRVAKLLLLVLILTAATPALGCIFNALGSWVRTHALTEAVQAGPTTAASPAQPVGGCAPAPNNAQVVVPLHGTCGCR